MNIENILKYSAGKSISISVDPHFRSGKNVPEYIEIFEEITEKDKIDWTSTSDKLCARIKNKLTIVEISDENEDVEIYASQSLAEIDSYLRSKIK